LFVPFTRSRLRTRTLLAALAVVVVSFCAYAFVHVGLFMAREDPVRVADAILVLAGTRVERPLEAADLYLAGYAPRVLVTRSRQERLAYDAARARGITLPDEFDSETETLTRAGVPPAALVTLDRTHDSTGEESRTLRDVALRQHWSRVIVVTSKYHLRRARLACRRALAGTSVEIVMRGSRYDPSEPEHWWRHRGDIRWLASEVPKLILYASGAGG
jgi:uncharacterized SAM-binding protein YcdF (DUF218 family)